MSARRKARKSALDFLYEADLRSTSALLLHRARAESGLSESEYVSALLEGVELHKVKIDECIQLYAQNWELDRIPAVDRNLMRIAIFEILFNGEIPDNVAISEAVELAAELSTENSAEYINGVLGRISSIKGSLI